MTPCEAEPEDARLRHLSSYSLRALRLRLESSPVGKRFVHGAFWSLTGTVVSRTAGLASSILAARIIGKTSYGQLATIQSTVGMFGTLAGFGMGTTASKFVGELCRTDPVRAGRIIALLTLTSWATSAALAAIVFFLASSLSTYTLAAPYLTPYLQIGALLLLLGGLGGMQIGVLSGLGAFKSIARTTLLAGLLGLPLTVAGALYFRLSGILWGMIVAQAATYLLNSQALRREAARHSIPISYASCMTEFPLLWRFSLPAVIAGLLVNAANWAAIAMLAHQPDGYSEIGLFNAANQWFNALVWIPDLLGSIALPLLAERMGAGDKASSAKLLRMSIKINAAFAIPLVTIGCLLSPYIMSSYGADFTGAWPTLILVLTTAGLLGLLIPVSQLMTAHGHMWLGCSMTAGWAVLFVGAARLLLAWGSFGLATARLLAYSAHAISLLVYSVVVAKR
jgi:O-antigen/teichoic acid export membrane protein